MIPDWTKLTEEQLIDPVFMGRMLCDMSFSHILLDGNVTLIIEELFN
jgi:hypothetical protein